MGPIYLRLRSKGFMIVLIDFESQQGDGVQIAQDSYSKYQDFVNSYLDNGFVLQDVSKQLSQLDQSMNNDEVLKQIRKYKGSK